MTNTVIDAQTIFSFWIEPDYQQKYQASTTPITVFLGGQPAAGKTQGQRIIFNQYAGQQLMSIVGDDFRAYHPDSKRLQREDPIHMPDITAKLAGQLTGLSVQWADAHQVSSIIEGTWRNQNTVLDEARKARMLGRRTHATIITVPPVLSRLGMLERFYFDVQNGSQARWTPPAAHETTVKNLMETVPIISSSGLMERFTVVDRCGIVHYDGADGEQFAQSWRTQFTRPLTSEEHAHVLSTLQELEPLVREYTPNNEEAWNMIQLIHQATVNTNSPSVSSPNSGSSTHGGVYVSPHTRNGYHVNGYWRSR